MNMASFIPAHCPAPNFMLNHNVHVRALSTLRVPDERHKSGVHDEMQLAPAASPAGVCFFTRRRPGSPGATKLSILPQGTRYRFRGMLHRPVETDKLFLDLASQAPHASNWAACTTQSSGSGESRFGLFAQDPMTAHTFRLNVCVEQQ
jgi:hypothetical protein